MQNQPCLYRRNERLVERNAAFAIAAALFVCAATPGFADERLDFWGFAGLEEDDTLVDDGAASSVSDLDTAVVGEGRLRYRNYYSELQSFRVETNVRHEEFLDADERSNTRIRTRADWWSYFDDSEQTHIRLRGEHEYKWRDGDWLINRLRGQVELHQEIDPRNLVFGRVQVSDRDYNDNVSMGLDHVRWLFEVGHEWTPHEDRTRVRTRVGYETADADTDRHSYDGYYAEIDGRHPIGPRTEIFGEARVHWRDYEGPFDAPDPTQREDERYRIVGGARYMLNENFYLVGEAGWQANRANVDEREYDGFVFRLGVEVDFDIWRAED